MTTLLDLLLPQFCLGCNREGQLLCRNCWRPLWASIMPELCRCPDCGRLTKDNRYCPVHRSVHALDGLIWVSRFDHSLIRELIHSLKYNGIHHLALPLGQLLAKRLSLQPWPNDLLIIPIPLHASRYEARGFNQAELISRCLPYKLETAILTRFRKTLPQAKLNRQQRLTNLSHAFGLLWPNQDKVANRSILLVDDVTTTGSTLEQAAAVLKRAGAASVWGAVIAKD